MGVYFDDLLIAYALEIKLFVIVVIIYIMVIDK